MNRGRPKRGKMSPSACGEDSTTAPHISICPSPAVEHQGTTLQSFFATQSCSWRIYAIHQNVFTSPAGPWQLRPTNGSGFGHQLPLDKRKCSGSVHEAVQSTLLTPISHVTLIVIVVERRDRETNSMR